MASPRFPGELCSDAADTLARKLTFLISCLHDIKILV
jgi:hypothetical protein